MGLLKEKNCLVFGVANRHSIAWSIAKAFAEQGAQIGIGYGLERLARRVTPLAQSIDAAFALKCDVSQDDELDAFFDHVQQTMPEGIDVMVHSLAYAERDDLSGAFVDTSRQGFSTALDVSAFSLIALCQRARPLMKAGGSVISMTYIGAERVVPNYRVMGPTKAALESTIQYLAHELGPAGIRVNGISAGPIKTLAASGIPGFKSLLKATAHLNPLRRMINGEDIAGTGLFLASSLSAGVTGEIIHVDGGYHILAAYDALPDRTPTDQ
ncbi:MAG: enoyl-ACP reductase [Myxococcota bacterium]|nr:enoyl-ACP reductase [Myxococcota bacterium]